MASCPFLKKWHHWRNWIPEAGAKNEHYPSYILNITTVKWKGVWKVLTVETANTGNHVKFSPTNSWVLIIHILHYMYCINMLNKKMSYTRIPISQSLVWFCHHKLVALVVSLDDWFIALSLQGYATNLKHFTGCMRLQEMAIYLAITHLL